MSRAVAVDFFGFLSHFHLCSPRVALPVQNSFVVSIQFCIAFGFIIFIGWLCIAYVKCEYVYYGACRVERSKVLKRRMCDKDEE